MAFNYHSRNQIVEKMQSTPYDLVIIGGGATGAGALLDAGLRGLKVCLIEMQDFSQGTSSRSTKLIHGGLRYLKQGDFKLVAEVGRERNFLYQNAPYLTQPTEVIIPFYKGGEMGAFTAKLAMIAYEYLAKIERKFKHKMLSKRDILNLVPNLEQEGLKGGVIYYEFKTNDSRLVIENIKLGLENTNAQALNYVKATGFEYDSSGKINLIKAKDLLSGLEFEIKTKSVISAAGPWTDDILKLNDAKAPNKVILTKGIHITLSKKDFPLEHALYFEVGKGRMIFAIPKFEDVYVGTTDTFYQDQKENPSIDKEDVTYILSAINSSFTHINLDFSHVKAVWSGLRPLVKQEGKGESEISRKDEVFQTESGLIAIAGGKLTGYRKMGEKVVDMAMKSLSTPFKNTHTQVIDFPGKGKTAEKIILEQLVRDGVSRLEAEKMYHWFGEQSLNVIKYQNIEGLPKYIGTSLRYSFEKEMVTNAIDFLIHRTQLAYFDWKLTLEILEKVREFIEKEGVILPSLEDELKILNGLMQFQK